MPRRTPPAWAVRVVSQAMPPEERAAILADLEELYAIRVRRSGAARALLWYLWQAVSFPLTRWRHGTWDAAGATARAAKNGDLAQDIRYALRGFVRTPSFTLTAIVTLTLGFGAVAAVLSLISGVVLKPLDYHEPERLVSVDLVATSMGESPIPQTAHTYLVFRDESRSFDGLGIWAPAQATVTGLDAPERVPSMWVTPGLFSALRIEPARGRAFVPEDAGRPDGPVILSNSYWRTRFGSDPDILDRTLRVDGQARRIVGVLPPGLTVLDTDAEFFAPFELTDQRAGPTISFDYRTVGRLAPGVTIEAATADLARLLPQAAERFEAVTPARITELGLRASVRPLRDVVVGETARTLWLLLGTVAMVLGIALANVANLVVVRTESRRREVAVRRALGASEGRLVRQFVVETLLLSVIAGVLGLVLAHGVVAGLVRLAPDALPRRETLGIDTIVVLSVGLLMLVTTLGVSLLTGVGRPTRSLSRGLRSGGRTSGPSRESQHLRSALAVSQISLAVALLVGAGLMIRSIDALRVVDPGFAEPGQVVTFRVSIPPSEASSPEAVATLHRQILEELAAVPGVASVGAVSGLPLAGQSNQNRIAARDPVGRDEDLPGFYKGVAGDYFEAMGIPLLAGRSLDWTDVAEGRLVGLVNESTARAHWGDPQAAIGHYIRHDARDPWREVVGVVGDVRDTELSVEPPHGVYWPIHMQDFLSFPWTIRRSLSYVVRSTDVDPLALLPGVRQAVWSVSPSLPLANLRTMDTILDEARASISYLTILLTAAALIALTLGLVGTFGVISHTVTSRLREIGVRLTFGASSGRVRLEVLQRTLRLAALGIAFGLAAAAVLSRFLASQLYNVTTADPLTYGVAAVGMAVAALIAGWIPAARASRVDPIEILNSD